jgi:hypothetical protein
MPEEGVLEATNVIATLVLGRATNNVPAMLEVMLAAVLPQQ